MKVHKDPFADTRVHMASLKTKVRIIGGIIFAVVCTLIAIVISHVIRLPWVTLSSAPTNSPEIEELRQNPGIIRNRQKINSAIKNAQAFLKVREEFGSSEAYIWGFVEGKPFHHKWKTLSELPAKNELSEEISKDLKNRDFSFVGPTIK